MASSRSHFWLEPSLGFFTKSSISSTGMLHAFSSLFLMSMPFSLAPVVSSSSLHWPPPQGTMAYKVKLAGSDMAFRPKCCQVPCKSLDSSPLGPTRTTGDEGIVVVGDLKQDRILDAILFRKPLSPGTGMSEMKATRSKMKKAL